jgi:hypothetical protein
LKWKEKAEVGGFDALNKLKKKPSNAPYKGQLE